MSNYHGVLDQLCRDIVTYKLANPNEFVGYTEQEIEELERYFSIRLVSAFRYFLRRMGHGAGEFMYDVDIFFDEWTDYCELRTRATEMLEIGSSDFIIPEDAFVFSAYLGNGFMFFYNTEERDDPPIYQYYTRWPEPRMHAHSFTSYLTACLQSIVACRKKLEEM